MTVINFRDRVVKSDPNLTKEQNDERRLAIIAIDYIRDSLTSFIHVDRQNNQMIIDTFYQMTILDNLVDILANETRSIIGDIRNLLLSAREDYKDNWVEYSAGAATLVAMAKMNFPFEFYGKIMFVGSDNVICFSYDGTTRKIKEITIDTESIASISIRSAIKFAMAEITPSSIFFDEPSARLIKQYLARHNATLEE